MDFISRLLTILNFTKMPVLSKEQILQYFPQIVNHVDLILVSNSHYICFKDFWTHNNLTQNIFAEYVSGINQLNTNTEKKFVFVLFKKRTLHSINSSNGIIVLEKNNIDKLFIELSYLLYSEKIYFYDDDFSTIMLGQFF